MAIGSAAYGSRPYGGGNPEKPAVVKKGTYIPQFRRRRRGKK